MHDHTHEELDEQEKLIARQLVRNPRASDNGISERTGVSVRTVGRKRQRLEEAGILSYFAHIDLSNHGTGQFSTRHMYVIKFRIGITYRQVIQDLQTEPLVKNDFAEIIYESHIAEIDGKIALLIFLEGASNADLVQTAQEKLIPSLLRNHGEDSIEEISTIRLLSPIRLLRNYLPDINMKNGYMKKDWPDDAIYVGP